MDKITLDPILTHVANIITNKDQATDRLYLPKIFHLTYVWFEVLECFTKTTM